MPLFGRHRTEKPSEDEQRAAEVDLERIRQGGIPLGAEQRLKRIATASEPFFTSDLTSKEYALAEVSGLQPVAQIMGSSVVHHGWSDRGRSSMYGGMYEMSAMSEPWNIARERAFGRLEQEARFAGADGVIGIEVNVTGTLGEVDNVEYVVFGTAVRDTAIVRQDRSRVGMCALSGQDVDKLRRIGAEVVGVIGHTSVVAVGLDRRNNYMMNAGRWARGGAANREFTEIVEAVHHARRLAFAEVQRQASAAGANDMVISSLRHTIDQHEFEQNDVEYHVFIVSMHVLGTAIRLGAHDPTPGPLKVPVMSINLGD